MIIRTPEEREGIIESGKRLGAILEKVAANVAPGVSTKDLDSYARELILAGGDLAVFEGYSSGKGVRPYPAALCVSVNDEVVHGIPNEEPRILRDGDIVALDIGLAHKGFVTDTALTVAVGKSSAQDRSLMSVTQAALEAGIAAARPGNRIGDISHAIESAYDGSGFSIVKVLGGHGVGSSVHEEPWISNVGHPGTGPEIVEGMVLALEPIANAGKAAITLAPDGWTYRTRDGSRSAHFEHTVLIEEAGTTVVTRRPSEF